MEESLEQLRDLCCWIIGEDAGGNQEKLNQRYGIVSSVSKMFEQKAETMVILLEALAVEYGPMPPFQIKEAEVPSDFDKEGTVAGLTKKLFFKKEINYNTTLIKTYGKEKLAADILMGRDLNKASTWRLTRYLELKLDSLKTIAKTQSLAQELNTVTFGDVHNTCI
jgi:hypothetical protein